MLDQISIQLHIDLPAALRSIAASCKLKGGARLAQAASECEALAGALDGAMIHPTVPAADVLCPAVDALRASGRLEMIAKFDSLISLIKGDQRRKIVGQAVIAMAKMLEKADKSGAKILLAEDPRSGDIHPIAEVGR